ncbi:hypothetical protein K402DRAFT_392040 [Aulographum hederae CBS 113979]|uniref:Yeast cell wall synthesis Kre9/Knh1-like N-terminal domain-containing protein n=1 Tax=Aulographum hederae CBS 113979 TaxID=1176131 RepID=A0A6G1H4Y0_9PEZI|nr:hypothetical protein K402DRAFT_392040 [Aulographum hederae CBS 113979]
MKTPVLSSFLCVLLTWIRSAAATPEFIDFPSLVTVGEPVLLKWTNTSKASELYDLALFKGNRSSLLPITPIDDEITECTYTWTPDSSLEIGASYMLRIDQTRDSDQSFSSPFFVQAAIVTSMTGSEVVHSTETEDTSLSPTSSVPSIVSNVDQPSTHLAQARPYQPEHQQPLE